MKLQIALPLVVLTAVFSFLILTAGCGDMGAGGGGSNLFTPLPACPSSLTAITGTTEYTVELTWPAVTGQPYVSTYYIYYKFPPATTNRADYLAYAAPINVGNVTAYTVTGLTSLQSYTFRVTSATTDECPFDQSPSADAQAGKPSWEEIK